MAVGLRRGGHAVTVVESRGFPRVKVCGECISPAASADLEAVLSPAELLAAGARRVSRFALELGERSLEWEMPAPAWTLSRGTLDDHLLARAAALGAAVLQPRAVRDVACARDFGAPVVVRLADGAAIEGDIVVHADGSGRHDGARATGARAGVVGLKCHLRVPGGVAGLRMRSSAGAYVGMVQVEGGESTVALVARAALVARHGGDQDALLRAAWPAYDPAWRTSEWLACGVPAGGPARPGHPRSFRIGNARAAVEPVGGEGIGLALWSGAALAAELGAARDWSPDSLWRAQRALHAAYVRRLRVRGPACRWAAEALMRPRLVGALWPLLAARPGLVLQPWYTAMGKPG